MDEIEIKVREAIKKGDIDKLDEAILELLAIEDISNYVNLLNELLLVTSHRQHQYIARTIQDFEISSSIPFIDKVLDSKFEGIPYTGSDSDSMAKWFSWALYCIGTEQAIDVIKKHTHSEDVGIRKEMRYRLGKIESEKK